MCVLVTYFVLIAGIDIIIIDYVAITMIYVFTARGLLCRNQR